MVDRRVREPLQGRDELMVEAGGRQRAAGLEFGPDLSENGPKGLAPFGVEADLAAEAFGRLILLQGRQLLGVDDIFPFVEQEERTELGIAGGPRWLRRNRALRY